MSLPEIDQLKLQLAEGNAQAFEQLYDLIGTRLFQTAFRISGSRTESEDAVQIVFANLFRSRKKLRKVEHLRSYLFVSLRHAIGLQIGKRSKTDSSLQHEIDPRSTSNHDPLEIRDALNRLPAEQREVIAFKIDGGFTFAEIAAMHEQSENTIASRYRYGIAKLKILLGNDDDN